MGIEQIKRHLKDLRYGEKILLLTPDYNEPMSLNDLCESVRAKVVWSNFITLAGAVEEILDDEDAPPSEREAFLLREFM